MKTLIEATYLWRCRTNRRRPTIPAGGRSDREITPLTLAFEKASVPHGGVGSEEALRRRPLLQVEPTAADAAEDVDRLAKAVLESLEDSKAEDIVTIDIKGKSSLADVMVIASGRSHRHVGAIADRLLGDLKLAGFGNMSVEGLPHCDWVLVDGGDVLVHIFRPEVRSFYNLEKMWAVEPSAPRTVGQG